MKPDMDISTTGSNFNNKCYIEGTQDLKSAINRTNFQLKFGNHPDKELQKDWKEHGEVSFIIEILENLKYDKDEYKTDYKDDLALLEMIWEEKLLQKGMEFYKKG